MWDASKKLVSLFPMLRFLLYGGFSLRLDCSYLFKCLNVMKYRKKQEKNRNHERKEMENMMWGQFK